ncbi:MAG: protease inhibitor I42 family protein [Caldisericia bacterium]|nr:protease inhibitor I42 family protein [Caldisericia bacterium]
MRKSVFSVALLLTVFLCASVVLVGCGSKAKNVDAESTELKYEMVVEDTFTVKLEENATTGYEWNFTIADADVLELVTDSFAKPDSENGMVGEAGEHTWVFKAIGKGMTQIDFNLSREWEEGSSPAETKIYNIDVK